MRGFLFIALSVVISGIIGSNTAKAQDNGSVCVVVYADANANDLPDDAENRVPNVNVTLSRESIILANAVTAREPYCFEGLSASEYAVAVDSPLVQAIDPTPRSVSLVPGDRQTVNISVVPRPRLDTSNADEGIVIPLTRNNRVILSAGLSALVMLILAGMGLVVYGLFLAPTSAAVRAPLPPERA
jgi:hypothetical protein